METMSDHRSEIRETAKRYTESCREAWDTEERWEQGAVCYDLEVFRSTRDAERVIVDFLLAGGGPTCRVSVDQWETVTFFYSWGMDENGQDLHELELYGDDADFWKEVAAEAAEIS
jgi:hypothetical protein